MSGKYFIAFRLILANNSCAFAVKPGNLSNFFCLIHRNILQEFHLKHKAEYCCWKIILL